MCAMFLLAFLSITLAAAVVRPEERLHDLIRRNLAERFMEADNDFRVSEENSLFFPLRESMEYNRRNGRQDYNVINAADFGEKVAADLDTWRGFSRVQEQEVERDMKLLFSETSNFKTNFLERGMTKSEIEDLPLGWQYLLPHVFYDSLELPGSTWAELVNSQPMNTALLYKVALLLTDKENSIKDVFIHHLVLPSSFRDDLGYILGYRWGINVDDAHDADDFNLKTLLHLPSDIVMDLDKDLYRKLNMREMLTDSEEWIEASQRGKVAWFTKFVKEDSWDDIVGSARSLMALGHVMSGAPLDLLRLVKKDNMLDANLLAGVINKTDMNPLRVQELWEALDENEQEWMFFGQAHKLDVSQLLAYYKENFAHLHNEKQFLDKEWLSGSGTVVPWANLMVAGLKHMDEGTPSTWKQKNLLELGKFLVLLFPPQLDAIPASEFDLQNLFDSVLSPRLTHCQRTVLYRKFRDTRVSYVSVPEILMAAIPSDTILQLGSYRAPIPVNWAMDQSSLVAASALFTPGQMHALHILAQPTLWQDETLKTILTQHPECLGSVMPRDFRANIGAVIDAIYLAGPANFHRVAEKIQSLPRALLMAWLEAVLVMPGSSKLEGTWWRSDVLLDRNVVDNEVISDVPNPDPSHPLRSQFNRFASISRSYLPSLALAGISCHCIEKIETHDSLEVLGVYRYHIESRGGLTHMPSMARKCWAKKIRQFLRVKADLFNVTVENELELLSLLSTSDIKAVGGEVLLTWGSAPLTGITHPKVQHEVLMTVAANPPHYLLHNGVGLDDVEKVTKTLFNSLLNHFGSVTLSALAHLHNLVPFADDRILEASAEDARLFVSTVLKPVSKAICLPTQSRRTFRSFLLQGYGEPEGWSALDLVQMGDLMVVFSRADFLKVSPTSLRRAASQLVDNSLFTEHLGDVRGFTDKALYHEACSSWLGANQGIRGFESTEFSKAWKSLAEFYILGNHLQVAVVEYNLLEVASREVFRHKKRQAQDYSEIVVKDLYIDVMNDMKAKFESGALSNEQKTAATEVITETQVLLGEHSFNVLGLERGSRGSQEVFRILKQYKESGNMTAEQDLAMQKLAEDTQVRMVQGIIRVFNYTNEEAAATYKVPVAQIIRLLARPTFLIQTTPGDREPDYTAVDPIEYTTTTTTTTVSTTTEDDLKFDLDTLTTFVTQHPASVSTSTSTTTIIPVDTSIPVFTRYEPQSPALQEQFSALPSLGSIKLGCNCIKAAGEAASALTAEHIRAMEDEEVLNCLDTLGKLPWPRASLRTVWAAIQSSLTSNGQLGERERRSTDGLLDREKMMLLENLLPAVAEYSPSLLDLRTENLDGISLIGRFPLTERTSALLVQRYMEENEVSISDPLTSTEVASLGQLLCGFNESQWLTMITPKIFNETLTHHLAYLDCSVTQAVKDHLGGMLLAVYGPTDQWTASDLLSVGWVASSIPLESISTLPADVMEGFSPLALRQLDNRGLQAVSEQQLSWLSPHTASFIKRDQLMPHLPAAKRRAIRAAGGESVKLRGTMEEVEGFMAQTDAEMAIAENTADTEEPHPEEPQEDYGTTEGIAPEPEPESAAVLWSWNLAHFFPAIVLVFIRNLSV